MGLASGGGRSHCFPVRWWPIPLLLFLLPLELRGERIQSVLCEHFRGDDFQRLSQYFSRKEPKFRHRLCRSDASQREGLYFIALLNRRPRLDNARVELELWLAGESHAHRLSLPLGAGKWPSRELWVGLSDGEHRHLRPSDVLAWRLALCSGGDVVCERKSFLFQKTCQRCGDAQNGAGER
jgi:hypothetical protein